MEIQGYAIIDRNAKSGQSAVPLSEFLGKTVRVMEFSVDGGALVINDQATGLAMFDKEDLVRSFKCGQVGDVVTPPNLDMMEQMAYVARAQSRKGGYNGMVRHLVVAASLHRQEFCDSLLWSKQ